MWLDKESQIDLLAYSPFAELITNITANERLNPLTIGLFGRWGVGKSTLLKLVEKNITERDSTRKKLVCVSLNSWMFEGYDDAKSAIMESLLRTLMDNQPAFEEFKEDIKGLISRINFIKLGTTVIKHGMPLAMSAVNPAATALTMAQYFSKDKRKEILDDLKQVLNEKSSDENTTVENIRQFRTEFSELINNSKIDNLIIMIDDLDRCTPERVIETLEAVKLFLSVPKTTFIIAVDNQVMKYSIENKYPKITEGSEDFSANYIEKIIQLPINIPELSETDIKNYLLLLVCELFLEKKDAEEVKHLEIFLKKVQDESIFANGKKMNLDFVKAAFDNYNENLFSGDSLSKFEEMFNIISKTSDVISSTLKGNPRQAKRFLNSFLIRKNLSEIYYKTDRNFDYAILAKLMALEYLDTGLFKELYKWAVQSQDKSSIEELKNLTEIAINSQEIPEEYRKWSNEKILRWLKSDPIDLYNQKLLKYFYLTRESLDINVSVSDSLSKAELALYNKILQSKRAADHGSTIKNLKDDKEIKYTKILDALIEKFKGDHSLFGKIQYVYINYPEYRMEIRDVIKMMKVSEIKLPTVTAFSSMYQSDKDGFKEVVDILEKKGLKQETIEIILKDK